MSCTWHRWELLESRKTDLEHVRRWRCTVCNRELTSVTELWEHR